MTTDSNIDEGKGRLKEAAGSLAGDENLKNEGKVDRATGSIKDKIDHIADKAKGVLHPDKD